MGYSRAEYPLFVALPSPPSQDASHHNFSFGIWYSTVDVVGKSEKSRRGLCGYATHFPPVTSFQIWNRVCKVARKSCALKR